MEPLEIQEILLNKHCSALLGPNKKERRIALDNIKKQLCNGDFNEEIIGQLYKTIQKNLVRALHDDSEACRESVVSLITQVIEKIQKDESILRLIFPELRERMGGLEIKEPSEEVRLLIIILLHTIILKYDSAVSPYLDDYIEILKKGIVDPYPKVKQESCECASDLSKAIPRDFHMQSESLIKPLLQAINHQHYKIRIAVIKCLGDVISNGNNKSVSDVTTALAERLFDQNPMVRKTVAQVVGMWLVKLYDRYSYWYKLIPLMLTSLSDEIYDQAEEAWKLWEAAGNQWALENEKDIKDKLDFLSEEKTWYPNAVRRPSIGCRELVQREMSKYLPGIVNELVDWKVDVRVKSAQLLCVTLQHAEEKITMHLSKILPVMYKAFCDEDKRVVENVQRSAELIGYFVPAEIYCGQILPAIENGANYGNLGVLASAILYSQKDSVLPKVKEIVDIIHKDDIRYTIKPKEQLEVLNIIGALQSVCKDDLSGNEIIQQIFNILISVQSVTESDVIKDKAKDLSKNLPEGDVETDTKNLDELSKIYTKDLLNRIQRSVPQWTLLSPEFHIFQFVLKELEFAVCAELDIILCMLKESMMESMDPEVVLKILWSIFELLQNNKLIENLDDRDYFFLEILTQVLPKQLVWRAGRSAEALRIASAACLNQGIYNMTKLSKVAVTEELFNLFLPHILGLVEDTAVKTRLFSLESLQTLIRSAKSVNSLTVDHVNTLIPVVMKRLDDVSDTIRATSFKVIKAVYKEPTVVCGDHIAGCLYNTLLVHLDDPNKDMQLMVLDTLKDVGRINPDALLSRISLDSFRDKEICGILISFLKDQLSK